MYVMLRDYYIKPWELNDTGEKYYEDIQAIMLMARMEQDAQKREEQRQRARERLKNM